ncbi:hypothetical protein Pint_18191 [Pistacia integerrima]|uniref:Uncharacterized protein n=1 Tax=Pistacia integerrima TaxID=434235 RepID=A0ACC0YZ16_9ROSI|nr:hypothetical protein Pint_18191 [Pistacia integerrima]
MDRITEDTCRFGVRRIRFARVLVEVDAARKLPESMRVGILNEVNDEPKILGIRVEYQWHPSQCEWCCFFGPGYASCPGQPRLEDKCTVVGKAKILVVEKDRFLTVNRKGKVKMPYGEARGGGTSQKSASDQPRRKNEAINVGNAFQCLAPTTEEEEDKSIAGDPQSPEMEAGKEMETDSESDMEGTDVDSDTASMLEFMKKGTSIMAHMEEKAPGRQGTYPIFRCF